MIFINIGDRLYLNYIYAFLLLSMILVFSFAIEVNLSILILNKESRESGGDFSASLRTSRNLFNPHQTYMYINKLIEASLLPRFEVCIWAYIKIVNQRWKQTDSPVKKKFRAQQPVKKVMLTFFSFLKGPITIEILEKSASINYASYCPPPMKIHLIKSLIPLYLVDCFAYENLVAMHSAPPPHESKPFNFFVRVHVD